VVYRDMCVKPENAPAGLMGTAMEGKRQEGEKWEEKRRENKEGE